MNKREFLKQTGVIGLASLLPTRNLIASPLINPNVCTLIPSETAGPFPLDLTANTYYFRQDIREGKPGVQLNQKLRIIGDSNCLPMQNVRVNIWHCDKDGFYSGYSQQGNPGQAGLTYLRGYQITDVNGEVEFITVFPGWYTGRICHIHFQVYVSSAYAAISQLTYDIAEKNALYSANASVYTKGTDPTSFAADNIFSDGYAYQLATLSPNPVTGGYDSFLEVTVQGSGTTGIGYIEKQNAKYFSLGQNYPNPYDRITTVPFTLHKSADVRLILFDLQGRKVHEVSNSNLQAGPHVLEVNVEQLNLPKADYVYQLEVKNADGVFTDLRLMTAM